MSRLFLVCVLMAILCAFGRDLPVSTVAQLAAQAQSDAVSIANEPHHKRLLYTNDLRLWDVTLPPGQSTPPFRFVHGECLPVAAGFDGSVNSGIDFWTD